jgi:hypothetical protein
VFNAIIITIIPDGTIIWQNHNITCTIKVTTAKTQTDLYWFMRWNNHEYLKIKQKIDKIWKINENRSIIIVIIAVNCIYLCIFWILIEIIEKYEKLMIL